MIRKTELILVASAAFLAGAILGGVGGALVGGGVGGAGGDGGSSPSTRESPAPSPGASRSRPSDSPGPSPSPGPVVLVGAGDIASCDKESDSATGRLIESIPEAIVFTLGDNAYESGSEADFRCYEEAWGAFRDRTRPVPGNHEYETRDARPYFDYFGHAAGPGPAGYYAYDAGEWRVYVLNSNCRPAGGCDAGDSQAGWLAEDLAAEPRRCVLAMWHHPVFSSGRHGNDPKMRPAWRILQEAGAELILNGHDHTYERFARQDDDGRPDPDGIREIVAGTGGKSHYPFPEIRLNSEVRDNRSYGVLKLVLEPDRYSWEFIPIAGDSFRDQGSDFCR